MRPLPISSGSPRSGTGDADAFAAGIAEGGGAVVDGDAAVATICASSASSAAAMTTKPGRQPR